MPEAFTTKRLILRRFVPEDWEALYTYLSIESVLRFLPEWECTQDACKEIALERSKGGDYWAVCLREDGRLIGHIQLHSVYDLAFNVSELGYVFNPAYYGQGYATEACCRILDHAFTTLGAHRVIATCDTENPASYHLMERLGMRREAHFIKDLYLRKPRKGQPVDWRDEYHYAILAEEWPGLDNKPEVVPHNFDSSDSV